MAAAMFGIKAATDEATDANDDGLKAAAASADDAGNAEMAVDIAPPTPKEAAPAAPTELPPAAAAAAAPEGEAAPEPPTELPPATAVVAVDGQGEASANDGGNASAAAEASPPGMVHRPSGQTMGSVVAPEVLLAEAKKHMRKTACTVWSEETGQYEFLSVFETTPKAMSFLGVGVRLYFDFVKQMGIIFFVLSILSVPSIVFNSAGSMLDDSAGFNAYIAKLSVANLGICPETGCRSIKEIRERCAFRMKLPGRESADDCLLKVEDITEWLGLLDGVGILVFIVFSIWFANRWIPRVVRVTDQAVVSPSDYTVWVRNLPAYLPEDHESYARLLSEHFQKVFSTCKRGSILDPEVIEEVVLVRDYDGSIMRFTAKGKALQDLDNAIALRERENLRGGKESRIKAQEKKIKKLSAQIGAWDSKLSSQAKKTDEQRGVCSAFVTVKHEEYLEKLLDEYRFANFTLFRQFQSQRLRFGGRKIRVTQACEPNDLYWENLDYELWKRRLRKGFVFLLTFLVLIFCSVAIAALKSKPSTAEVLRSPTWVISTTQQSGAEKLSLCNLRMYSSASCLDYLPNSNNWVSNRLFTADGELGSTGLPSNSSCEEVLSIQRNTTTNGDATAWVGVEFASAQSVKCMDFQQYQADFNSEIRVYACPTMNRSRTNFEGWSPAENCQAMEIVYPIEGAASSTVQLVADTSCASNPADFIPFEVAEEASAAASDPATDTTMDCFCKQQARSNLASFLAPPYETPEEKLCEEWSKNLAETYGRTAGSVIAVLVLNQVLLVLYAFFIAWERLSTVTELTQSQLWKLFLSQFVNTGLLIALINANFKDSLPSFPFIRVLSIGIGDYNDLTANWFVAVGATLVLTIFMQVFTTTLPPLLMSYIVQPMLARIFSRAKVTQEAINSVYTLPAWNLSLRLAQTLNVIFCVVMYSGGMPILYPIGCVYCVVAYWLDRWCLLLGSRRPPAYTEDILQMSMHLMPWAAFLHVAVAGWTFGNQVLFPSRWSSLKPLAEAIFGITEARYNEVMEEYRTGAITSVTWDLLAARFLDFSREGAWLLMLIFLACAAYYIVHYLYLLVLRPFLSPLVLLAKTCLASTCPTGCCTSPKNENLSTPYKEAKTQMEAKGMPSSYNLSDNVFYRPAYKALQHTEEQVMANRSGSDGSIGSAKGSPMETLPVLVQASSDLPKEVEAQEQTAAV